MSNPFPNPRTIKVGKEARESLLEGATALCDIVKTTLGPGGQNAIIGVRGDRVQITNDGVSIADQIHFEDDVIKNLGVRAIREASKQTANEAGDGTTTTTILAHAITEKAIKASSVLGASKSHGNKLRNQINEECKVIVSKIKESARPISTLEEMRHVAFVSSENDEMADKVSSLWDAVGKDGSVILERGSTPEITTNIIDGIKLDVGFTDSWMSNNDKATSESDDTYVLVTNQVVDYGPWLDSICAEIGKQGKFDLVIVGLTSTDKMKTVMYESHKALIEKGAGFHITFINAPHAMYQNYILEDLATFLGGKFIDIRVTKIEDCTFDDLGITSKCVIDRSEATFVGGKSNPEVLNTLVNQIKSQIENEKGEFDKDHKQALYDRVARLNGKVGTIRVGANSTSELQYIYDKVEDTVWAVRGALKYGVVKGGGMTYVDIAKELPDTYFLKDILPVINKVLNENAGEILDINDNIIDPANVSYVALEKAVSVAGALITTTVAIDNVFERKDVVALDRIADSLSNNKK